MLLIVLFRLKRRIMYKNVLNNTFLIIRVYLGFSIFHNLRNFSGKMVMDFFSFIFEGIDKRKRRGDHLGKEKKKREEKMYFLRKERMDECEHESTKKQQALPGKTTTFLFLLLLIFFLYF